ncbi:MAG: NYN domain-containing protein [Gammaproteobacteria bacterium]|nr:NYN domain-containing protein [Gammaproteobacteria bacterium]MDH5592015.1 NYN domain-containing protein [Gammaproteobacteria bacterium]
MEKEGKIALLIDCDNVSHKAIDGVINELAKYGVVNIRKAYGDWKSPNLQGWEEKLHPFAIIPVQQFAYTKGKNATDAAMIIDAMDLLYSRELDGFALMTSDSDFTPLVMRILTNGLKVYGFGEKKTPAPFINACSQFIFVEKLIEVESSEEVSETTGSSNKKLRNELRQDAWLVKLLRTAVEQSVEDDGWSHLGQVGQYISNNTSFSPVNYGYKKLSEIVKESGLFNIEMRKNNSQMYLKDNRKS